jgi:acyl-CoA dehydrogenase
MTESAGEAERARSPEDRGGGSAEELDLVVATARQIFTGSDAGTIWRGVEESGLHLLAAPRPEGGDWLAAAAAVTKVCAELAAPTPYADIAIVTAPVLGAAGLQVAAPIALADDGSSAGPEGGGLHLDVVASDVAAARFTDSVAFVCDDTVAVVPRSSCRVTEDVNLAGESRDRLRFAGTVEAGSWSSVPGAAAEVRLRGALARAVQICGAAAAALHASVAYANQRVQFGRPIARFQVVQHAIAELAVEVEAMTAASEAAVATCAAAGFASARSRVAVAVAKAQASEGAGVVARIAHQVHGAIGTTKEHSLHLTTTRLWSWRDEYGSERVWQLELGRAALAEDVWEVVT